MMNKELLEHLLVMKNYIKGCNINEHDRIQIEENYRLYMETCRLIKLLKKENESK